MSSQADSERADLDRERGELATDPAAEREELVRIYVDRGLDHALAIQVADRLMAKDALGAHARDELGISAITAARPVQAALTSAVTFSARAAMPLLVAAASLLFLAGLGALGARAGDAPLIRADTRVTFWGRSRRW